MKNELTQQWGCNVFTDILPAGTWHDAEEYHQKYVQKQKRLR